jgi:hypothetical protein
MGEQEVLKYVGEWSSSGFETYLCEKYYPYDIKHKRKEVTFIPATSNATLFEDQSLCPAKSLKLFFWDDKLYKIDIHYGVKMNGDGNDKEVVVNNYIKTYGTPLETKRKVATDERTLPGGYIEDIKRINYEAIWSRNNVQLVLFYYFEERESAKRYETKWYIDGLIIESTGKDKDIDSIYKTFKSLTPGDRENLLKSGDTEYNP